MTVASPSSSRRRDRPGHPAATPPARSIAAVEQRGPRVELCAGVLEIRWYSQLDIPAFAYGAGLLALPRPGRDVDEAAMRRCAAAYALFAASMGGRPPATGR